MKTDTLDDTYEERASIAADMVDCDPAEHLVSELIRRKRDVPVCGVTREAIPAGIRDKRGVPLQVDDLVAYVYGGASGPAHMGLGLVVRIGVSSITVQKYTNKAKPTGQTTIVRKLDDVLIIRQGGP